MYDSVSSTKLVSSAIAIACASAAQAQQVFKIGHVGPVSGPNSHLGKDNENAARMAVDELNSKGFTINGQRVTLQLLAEDDASDPKQGTAVAQKLVDAKVDGIVGHLNSGTSVPASRIYHNAGLVQVSPATTAILTAIPAKKPDLIFFGGMDAVAGPMLKQMRALGIEARFMGGDGICTEALGRLAGAAVGEGKVVCAEAGGVKGAQEQKMTDFRARFKQKTGLEVQLYAPYVYDSVMVMASAMQNAKSADPAKYLPALKKIKYEGVTGTIQFDPSGDILNGALTLYTYKDGKRTRMDVIR